MAKETRSLLYELVNGASERANALNGKKSNRIGIFVINVYIWKFPPKMKKFKRSTATMGLCRSSGARHAVHNDSQRHEQKKILRATIAASYVYVHLKTDHVLVCACVLGFSSSWVLRLLQNFQVFESRAHSNTSIIVVRLLSTWEFAYLKKTRTHASSTRKRWKKSQHIAKQPHNTLAAVICVEFVFISFISFPCMCFVLLVSPVLFSSARLDFWSRIRSIVFGLFFFVALSTISH